MLCYRRAHGSSPRTKMGSRGGKPLGEEHRKVLGGKGANHIAGARGIWAKSGAKRTYSSEVVF